MVEKKGTIINRGTTLTNSDLRQEPLLQTEHQHMHALYFDVYSNWKPRVLDFKIWTKKCAVSGVFQCYYFLQQQQQTIQSLQKSDLTVNNWVFLNTFNTISKCRAHYKKPHKAAKLLRSSAKQEPHICRPSCAATSNALRSTTHLARMKAFGPSSWEGTVDGQQLSLCGLQYRTYRPMWITPNKSSAQI